MNKGVRIALFGGILMLGSIATSYACDRCGHPGRRHSRRVTTYYEEETRVYRYRPTPVYIERLCPPRRVIVEPPCEPRVRYERAYYDDPPVYRERRHRSDLGKRLLREGLDYLEYRLERDRERRYRRYDD